MVSPATVLSRSGLKDKALACSARNWGFESHLGYGMRRVVQWKHVEPIIQGSMGWNHFLLNTACFIAQAQKIGQYSMGSAQVFNGYGSGFRRSGIQSTPGAQCHGWPQLPNKLVYANQRISLCCNSVIYMWQINLLRIGNSKTVLVPLALEGSLFQMPLFSW